MAEGQIFLGHDIIFTLYRKGANPPFKRKAFEALSKGVSESSYKLAS